MRDPRAYLVALVLATYAGILRLTVLGADSWALIESARIASWSDLAGTFTEPFMEGRYRIAYYRPVLSLSLALDWAVGGIRPVVYQLDQLTLFLAAALVLLALVRRLTGPGHDLEALLATAAFALYPPLWQTIPVASRRHDVGCLLLLSATVLAHLERDGTARERVRWRTGALALLAAGIKETGYLALPMALWTVVVFSPRQGIRAKLTQALRTTLPELLALALLTGARLTVLRGASPADGALLPTPAAMAALARRVLLADLDLAQTPAGEYSLVIVGVGVMFLAALLARTRRSGADGGACNGRALRVLTFALGWFLMAGLLLATQGVAGITSWHLPLPMAAVSLGTAALMAGLRSSWSRWAKPARMAALLCIAPLLSMLILHVSHSQLVRRDDTWARWDAELRPYLDDLERRIRESPDGAHLEVPRPPGAGTSISSRSQAAWARLHFPERRLIVVGPLGRGVRVADGVVLTLEDALILDWSGLEGETWRAISRLSEDTPAAQAAVKLFAQLYVQGRMEEARAALVSAAKVGSQPAATLTLLERFFESIAAQQDAGRARAALRELGGS